MLWMRNFFKISKKKRLIKYNCTKNLNFAKELNSENLKYAFEFVQKNISEYRIS